MLPSTFSRIPFRVAILKHGGEKHVKHGFGSVCDDQDPIDITEVAVCLFSTET